MTASNRINTVRSAHPTMQELRTCAAFYARRYASGGTVRKYHIWLVFSSLALQSCGLLVDNRERIAHGTIIQKNGSIDEKAFNGALLARFPIGSPGTDLTAFVESLGGKCGRIKETLRCDIPVSGTLCVTNSIEVVADISASGSISTLAAKKQSDLC